MASPRGRMRWPWAQPPCCRPGNSPSFYSGSWAFPNFREVDFNVSARATIRLGPGGRANYVYYYPLVVPKTTQAPECAWNLLKFFNGPAMETIIREGGLQGTSFAEQEKWFITDPLPPANKHVMLDAAQPLRCARSRS